MRASYDEFKGSLAAQQTYTGTYAVDATSNLEQHLVSAVSIRGHKLHEKLGLRRLRRRGIMDWSVCLADAVTRGRKEQGGNAFLGHCRFALRFDMAMERYELHGVKVYQLNICETIGDHHLWPGIATSKLANSTWHCRVQLSLP